MIRSTALETKFLVRHRSMGPWLKTLRSP